MVSMHFSRARDLIEELVDEGVKVYIVENESVAEDGDLRTVADHNGLTQNTTVRKWTVKLVGKESNETYARTIYYNYREDPSVSLFDWVEVDPDYRGNGIGRSFIEESVRHIDSKTSTEEIYLKLENPTLQSVLIDIGFREVEIDASATWLVR